MYFVWILVLLFGNRLFKFFSAARNHLYDAQEQYIYPEITVIFADNVQKEIQRK